MPPPWNDGMLEQWNNGQKRITSVSGSRFLGSIFKSSVDVFSIHGLFIPGTVLFFNQMEHQWSQYSIIPLFHYSIIPIVSEAN